MYRYFVYYANTGGWGTYSEILELDKPITETAQLRELEWSAKKRLPRAYQGDKWRWIVANIQPLNSAAPVPSIAQDFAMLEAVT